MESMSKIFNFIYEHPVPLLYPYFPGLIPISHRCTELKGREWKEVFLLSINDKRLISELKPIRNETAFIRH